MRSSPGTFEVCKLVQPFLGLTHPNYGEMGTESLPVGNGPANPYGQASPTSSAATDTGASMQGHQDSSIINIGYRPETGRADRLNSNIVGSSDFNNIASGGYSGGATEGGVRRI